MDRPHWALEKAPLSKYPGPESQIFVSPHRGLMNISLHVVGRLEYWNIGSKIGTLLNLAISKCPCIL
jgi:hypothetical protein